MLSKQIPAGHVDGGFDGWMAFQDAIHMAIELVQSKGVLPDQVGCQVFHACATSLGKGGKIGRSQWTYLSPSFQTTVGCHADNGRIEDVDGFAS